MAMAMEALNRKNGETDETTGPLGIGRFLSEDQLAKLRGLMHPKRADKGSFLFWEGEPAGKLYYILSGKVKLRKSAENGKTFILSILKAGDIIFEPGDSAGAACSCSAEVIERAELGMIQWNDLEMLLYRHGDIAIRFMNWMALMQRWTASRFRDLLLFGKPGALASTLIRLANTYGVAGPDGIRIALKLTHAELADFIGATRESVNRMLNGLKDEGIIDIRGGRIVILRLNALRSICHCPACPGCPKEVCRI